MIKTKSIWKDMENDDGLRVLITRWHPRGVKKERYDLWVRELAPSPALLKSWKNAKIEWVDFEDSLFLELRNNMDSVEIVQSLHSKGITQDITLLCHEKDGEPCHRYMVKDLIDNPKLLKNTKLERAE